MMYQLSTPPLAPSGSRSVLEHLKQHVCQGPSGYGPGPPPPLPLWSLEMVWLAYHIALKLVPIVTQQVVSYLRMCVMIEA